MLGLDPKQTCEFPIVGDNSGAVFITRYLTSREYSRAKALVEAIDEQDSRDGQISKLLEAIGVGLVIE